jgi:NADH-quinone oxidoreductase subunit A
MLLFYNKFSIIGLYILAVLVIGLIILVLASITSIHSPDLEKLSTYECGFDPYEDTRNNFDIKFYLVAIIFLIFDLETIFFLPFSISLSFLNGSSLVSVIDFIIELVIGFIYAWKIGALDWD